MRVYHLSSGAARRTVNLCDYESVITQAVTSVMSSKDVTVIVDKDSYTVSPTPTQGEAIRIGRLICKSDLNQYCIQIPKLFTGENIETKEELNDQRNNDRVGGHH